MYYATCRGCAVDVALCTRRSVISKGISGLGLTSIKFKCTYRLSAFRRGERVTFDTVVYFECDGGVEREEARFAATVIRELKPGRFLVRVDDGPCFSGGDDIEAPECFHNKSGYLSISYLNMKGLDEPDRRVCQTCSALVDFESECWKSPYFDAVCARIDP